MKLTLSSKYYKYGYLLTLILFGITQGLARDVITPTMPNLSRKLELSYTSLGKIISLSSIPGILSLIMFGFLYDCYPFFVPYFMVFECFVVSLCSFVIAFTSNYIIYGFAFYIQSALIESLNNGGQWNVIRLFQADSVGKMQLYHLGFGIGALLSGLISHPFLPVETNKTVRATKYCQMKMNISMNNAESDNNNIDIPIKTQEPFMFEYIYIIIGFISLIITIIFALYNLCIKIPEDITIPPKRKIPLKRSIDPRYFSPNRPIFGSFMAILLFLHYFTYIGGVQVLVPYLAVFATDSCKNYRLTGKKAALLHSVVNGAFLLGRVFSSFTVDKNPMLFLLIHNTLNVIFITLLGIFGNDYELALWICFSLMRFVNGVNYPGGTATINRYIIISGSLISLAFIGTQFGGMIGSYTGGYVIDNYPSATYFYYGIGGMSILLIVNIIIFVLGTVKGMRAFENVSKEMKMVDVTKKDVQKRRK